MSNEANVTQELELIHDLIAKKKALDFSSATLKDLEQDLLAHREILSHFVVCRHDLKAVKEEVLFCKADYSVLLQEAKKRKRAAKLGLKEAPAIADDAFSKALEEYREDYSNAKFSKDMFGVTFDESLVQSNTILSVRHLKQFFGTGENKTKAVHDVSFDIKEGECFGLVGESGCGKTTTGRTVIGLYDPTSGAIYYKGFRIAAGDRWNRKEIKWSRIHANDAIRELDRKYRASLKNTMYQKLKDEYRLETEKIRCDSNLSDEEMKIKISEAKAKLKIDLAKPEVQEEINKLKADYDAAVKQIQDELNAHIAEQRAAIKKIAYDNKHSSRRLRNEIQMIFQDPIDSLDPRMTVEDIITEGLRIQGSYNHEENRKAVEESLKKVGLIPEYASRYPHEFSGGQRQRIGIARAMVMKPKLLICDEPISALDVSIRAQVLNLLNKLKQEMGLTMIFIAHDLSVVKYFCDRIAVMYFGNMVELATSDELFAHPLHPYTKALLSAIPKPDPLSEKKRIRTVYNPAVVHDYTHEKPSFREILPGHFVLCNSKEEEEYKKEIAALDEKKGGE